MKSYYVGLKDEDMWQQGDIMRIETELADNVNPLFLEKAVNRTIMCYIPLQITPEIKEDKIFYQKNPLPPVIRHISTGDAVEFGGMETNNYPWSISYDKNTLTAVFHHGLFDGKTAFDVLRTLLYEYYTELGLEISDNSGIYTPENIIPFDIQTEKPFEKYGALEMGAVNPPKPPSRAFDSIQDKYLLNEDAKLIRLTFDTDAFLSQVKELNTTPFAVMAMLLFEGMRELTDKENPNMMAMVNADLRNVFDSKVTSNFAQGRFMDYDCNDTEYWDDEMKCAHLRAKMNMMLEKNMSIAMLKKSLGEWAQLASLPYSARKEANLKKNNPDNILKLSILFYLLSYMGHIDMPQEIACRIHDIKFTMKPRRMPLMIECFDFNNKMRFNAYSCLNTLVPLEYVRDRLIDMGVPCKMEQNETIPSIRYTNDNI